MNNSFREDLKISFEFVWGIISLVILFILFISAVYPELLLKISPVCVSVGLYNEQCIMCGMTRAFIEIAGGNFSNAFALNKFSIVLFTLFVLNEIIYTLLILNIILKKIKIKKKFNKLILKNQEG